MLDSSLLHDQVNRIIMSQQSHGDFFTVKSVCWAKACRMSWLELFIEVVMEGEGGRMFSICFSSMSDKIRSPHSDKMSEDLQLSCILRFLNTNESEI